MRYGIRTKSIEKCDEIWKTCCALYNILLFADELHKNWNQGASSIYEINNAKYQKKDAGRFAINRLRNPKSCSNKEEYVVNDKGKDKLYLETYYTNAGILAMYS